MIRATYGHSIEIELDLPTDEIPKHSTGHVSLPKQMRLYNLELHQALETTSISKPSLTLWKQDTFESIDLLSSRSTVRAIADGHTIFRAGKTVFLTDEVPPEYLYRVGDDDPMITDTVARWEREEESNL